jgi:hypothetical protein
VNINIVASCRTSQIYSLLVIVRLTRNLHFKTFKTSKLENILYITGICTLHVSTNIDHLFFFFLVAPTLGSLLPLWSIGLSFLSFLIRDSR